jgi:hypothetical protein
LEVVAITRGIGAVLVVVGLVAYLGTGMESVTALAPAVLGVVLGVLGLLAGKPDLHRHMIHAALVVALLGLLASAMPLMELPALFAGEAERPVAVVTSGLMALLCLVYLVLGVRSFVAARSEDGS